MNTPALLLIMVACLVSESGSLWAAETTAHRPQFGQAKLSAIDSLMQRFVTNQDVAGVVTVVATKDQIVHTQAAGKADIEHDRAMALDSVFWIASMTKPITAAAVLMLQDEGKLSVDDEASKYLPDLARLIGPDGKPARVTLKHLLTHSSGMVPEAPVEVLRSARTLADLIPAYAKVPLRFEPGTKWEYCQSGINSLGRIIEVVSGKPLPEFLSERLFLPLGMKDTAFYLTDAQAQRMAKAYGRSGGQVEEAPVFVLQGQSPTSHDRYPAANGGLFSTAGDYARFCQMLLNDGSIDGKQFLKPQTVHQMRTVQFPSLKTGFTPGNGWGLGVCVVRDPQGVSGMLSSGTFGHGGAYGTQAWIDPVKGVAYIMMIQVADAPNGDDSAIRKAFQTAAAAAIQ